VIDGATNQVIATIPVGDCPWALAWNSIQNRTYVANYISSSISVIRDVTGIEESRLPLSANRQALGIYSNPARGYLGVCLPLKADRQTIKIFDISGKLLKEVALPALPSGNEAGIKISLKGINPGTYFIKVGSEVKKFIIVK